MRIKEDERNGTPFPHILRKGKKSLFLPLLPGQKKRGSSVSPPWIFYEKKDGGEKKGEAIEDIERTMTARCTYIVHAIKKQFSHHHRPSPARYWCRETTQIDVCVYSTCFRMRSWAGLNLHIHATHFLGSCYIRKFQAKKLSIIVAVIAAAEAIILKVSDWKKRGEKEWKKIT